MKKILFSLLTVVLVLTSCGGTSPTGFNDAIVKANTNIAAIFTTYSTNLMSNINSETYAEIAAQADSTLTKVEAELKTVKDLEAPKGAEAYKDAAVKSFECIKEMIEAGKGYAKLTKDSSEEEFNKVQQAYLAKEGEYSKLINELTTAQAAYAKEVGRKIEP